jgi:hypothetical protein
LSTSSSEAAPRGLEGPGLDRPGEEAPPRGPLLTGRTGRETGPDRLRSTGAGAPRGRALRVSRSSRSRRR